MGYRTPPFQLFSLVINTLTDHLDLCEAVYIEWRLKQHRRSFIMTDKCLHHNWFISLSLRLESYGSMAWVGQSGLVHLFEMLDVPICWRDFFFRQSFLIPVPLLLLTQRNVRKWANIKHQCLHKKMWTTPHGSNPFPANSSQSVSPYNSSGFETPGLVQESGV